MSTAAAPTTRVEQARATRQALIESARTLFTERGFAATSTEAVVAAARAGTRGALYHHFPDKEALFLAVFDAVQRDLGREIQEQLDPAESDPLRRLQAMMRSFVDCVRRRPDARALLRDGPVALGWERFRAVEAEYGQPGLQHELDRAVAAGVIDPQPTGQLARLLVSMFDEAALVVTTAADEAAVQAEVADALGNLVEGLRARG